MRELRKKSIQPRVPVCRYPQLFSQMRERGSQGGSEGLGRARARSVARRDAPRSERTVSTPGQASWRWAPALDAPLSAATALRRRFRWTETPRRKPDSRESSARSHTPERRKRQSFTFERSCKGLSIQS